MPITWPTSILPLPNQDFSGEGPQSMAETTFESGRVRQRLRDVSDRQIVSVNWELSDEQMHNFRGFVKHKLENGSLTFTIPMPFGDGLKTNTASFVGGSYTYQGNNGLNHAVSARLLVEDPDIMGSAEADSVFGA